MTYGDRLKYLNLPSLKYRRRRGDLIQLYKIVHNIDNLNASNFFRYSHNTHTRGDRFKIYIGRYKTNVRQNVFLARTVSTWNKLSFKTKSANCINSFKNSIDRELKDLKYVYDD